MSGSPEHPVVLIPVATFQPWPDETSTEIAGVTFYRDSGDDAMTITAKIIMDENDSDDVLHLRASAMLDSAIQLSKRALKGYPMSPKTSFSIDRGPQQPIAGGMSFGGAATITREDPITTSQIEPLSTVAKTYANANADRQRNLRAAAYWVNQMDTAPDLVLRLAACYFAIESALYERSRKDEKIHERILEEMERSGFVFTVDARKEAKNRLGRVQGYRSNIVHEGNLEHVDLPTVAPQMRDLAHGIVDISMGLRAPATFSIFNGINGVGSPP